MDAAAIGKQIRELRGSESQQSCANKLGISKSALTMYECGNRIPRDEIKLRISSYFNVPVELLFYTIRAQIVHYFQWRVASKILHTS